MKFLARSMEVIEYNGAARTLVLLNDSSNDHVRREEISIDERNVAPWTKLALGFLPEGYPSSVTSDYLAFQTWDTLQGLSTYIRSMLSTQALLSGIGVGASTATAIGATFQWFLRDLTGMLGGVVFTLYQGSNLDNRAKQWRLAADFLNDIGMLMDLVSPLFPRAFMLLLCLGSVFRAVTGVAGGATRAALTQHFAIKQNAADVSAKEGSQETAATLVGMILGMFVARLTVNNGLGMWACFLLLTAFHIFANYKAVQALCLTSLNAERLAIVLESYLKEHEVLSPKAASSKETILPQLFRRHKQTEIVFGGRVSSLCLDGRKEACSRSINKYGEGMYLLVLADDSIHVIPHRNSTFQDHLSGYTHALVLQHMLTTDRESAEELSTIWMNEHFQEFVSSLQKSGWNINHVLISSTGWSAEWTTKKQN